MYYKQKRVLQSTNWFLRQLLPINKTTLVELLTNYDIMILTKLSDDIAVIRAHIPDQANQESHGEGEYGCW